jgi:HAD superfamily phosphatase (TIGR01668 family)
MIGILRPDFQYETLQDIPVEDLHAEGIQGLLLDLDNTIAPWDDKSLTREVIDWFEKIKTAGIKACIVSNNTKPDRVSAVADVLGILYVYNAAKPSKKAFRLGIETLGIRDAEAAVIGDQLFTDVFGGNRSGLKTILVSPIDSKEFKGTKILRFMERMVGRKARFTNDER